MTAKATLIDVALHAGVSTATVSRVINMPEVVQPSTRQKVQTAISDLGYIPNFGARVLAAKRTNTIGAIVPTLENAIFARGLEAFQKELSRNGITLLVASSSYSPEVEAEQIISLVHRGADAILLIGYDREDGVYDYLKRNGTPYAVAWAHDPSQPHASVGFDNRLAMEQLAARVISMGHRRIGFISAQRDGNDRARNRWLGALDAVLAAGLPPETLTLSEKTYSIEAGESGLRELMSITPRPTAVICGNDVLAAGALVAARDLKLGVPEDLSITGFDDIDISEILSPPLTTVHVPHRRMGEVAAQLLMDHLNGRAETISHVIDTEIVMRGTLGKAP